MGKFQSQAVRVFKALADPTRYRIVCLLAEKGELGCGDFEVEFNLSKSAMSHHYRILENAELIITRKEGRHIYTTVNVDILEKFIRGFGEAHLKPEHLEVV